MEIFKQDRQPTLAKIPSWIQVDGELKYIEIHKNKTYRVYLFDELLKCWDSMWFDV